MDNAKQARWLRVCLLSVLVAGFALHLHELTLQDIWWDEARNIDVALRPFFQVATAPELDIHPPVYFWLLHFWGRIAGLGDSSQGALALRNSPEQIAFISRYLSLFAGMVSIALLYQFTRAVVIGSQQSREESSATSFSLSGAMAGLCATVFATFSPFWLAESQETRMYSVGFAVLLAAAIALLKVLRNPSQHPPPSSRLPLFTFVIFSALALLIHYNALFILVSWYLWWGLWALLRADRWRVLREITLAGSAMTLLVLPVAPIALRQIPTYENPNLDIPSVAAYLQQNWQAYIGGYAWSDALGDWLIWLALVLLLVGTLVYLWPASSASFSNLAFLLFWLLGGLALYYIAVLDRGAFNVRYSSFVTPALYALLGIALAALARLWRPLTLGSLALLLVGLVPAIRADLYEPAFAREDISGVTDWLRSEARPGDLIFVDQKYPFGFYYAPFMVDAEESSREGDRAEARYLFVDINTIDQRLNAWAKEAKRIYWVQWFESDTDPRRAVPFLLDQAGTHSGEKNFQGYSVDWWELEPPNTFALATEMQSGTHIFPPAVETVAYSFPHKIAPDTAIPVAIRWKRVTEGRTDRPLKARVALYSMGGNKILGQDDRPLLNDRHRLPSEWSSEDRPLNVYMIPAAADLAAGDYELRLLIYDAETLEPLTYVDMAGNPAGIEAVLGKVVYE